MGNPFKKLFGTPDSAKDLRRLANASFESGTLQKFLPPSLRIGQTGEFLQSGIQGIGELIQNPGGLSPNVLDAIRPFLAQESENIQTNFRGIRANQAGGAARSNLPVSIKNALASSLDVSEERAQRGARRGAIQDSDQLRRQDLSQTFAILDSILQFLSSGRGQATQGLGAAAGAEAQSQAAVLSFIGSLGSSAATAGAK